LLTLLKNVGLQFFCDSTLDKDSVLATAQANASWTLQFVTRRKLYRYLKIFPTTSFH